MDAMMSLQNLCLQHIVQNFEMYHLVYSSTDDKRLKLMFKFLQRVYSLHILKELDKKFSVEANYADFLINKYLKELCTNWLKKCSPDDIAKKFIEIGNNLETVHFQGNSLPWEKVLCHVPNAKTVVYKRFCNPKFLCAIAKFCHKVETLDFEHSVDINNNGIKHLCHSKRGKAACPALKRLLIYDTEVNESGIKHLIKRLHSVEEIDNLYLPPALYSLHKKITARDKIKPYNLTHLNLRYMENFSEIRGVIKVCISVCPNLKSFSSDVSTQKDLDLCSRLPNLEELCLECVNESPLSIDKFLIQKGSKLLRLELENFSVSVTVLAKNCPFLNSLILGLMNFQSNRDIFLPFFLNLEKISFEGLLKNSFTAQAVNHFLISSPNLKELHFEDSDMFSLGFKHEILKGCEQSKLQEICFSGFEVEPKFLQDVLNACSSLKVLNVGGCDFDNYEEELDKLRNIASTLPNKPAVCTNMDLYESIKSFVARNYWEAE